MSRIRPFRLVNASEWARLRTLVEQSHTAWAARWFGEDYPAITVGAPPEPPASPAILRDGDLDWWRASMFTEEEWVGIGLSPLLLTRLVAAACRNSDAEHVAASEHALASALGQTMLRGLLQTFFDVTEQKQPKIPAAIGREIPWSDIAAPGSGVAWLRLEVLGLECHILVSTSLLVRLATPPMSPTRAREALRPLREAIQQRKVSLEVRAGSATLSVRELLSLGVGDVVRLDTATGEPMNVVTGQNRVVCLGDVGMQHGHRAVQIRAVQ